MAIEKIPNVALDDNDLVKVKQCGNVSIATYTNTANKQARIKKLDKDRYVELATGEIKEFNHNKNRLDDTQSLRESLARLRDYLNTNITNARNCRWLTLTYRNVMNDSDRLYSDFKEFNRLCRKKYGSYEYIVAAEYQKRGSLHLHCVLIFDSAAPFMKNKDVADIWKHGFVNVRKLVGVDDIGRYLTAYIGDAPLDEIGRLPSNVRLEDIKVIEVKQNGKKVTKALVKGARLALMPPGFNLYRISKGIRKPETVVMTNAEVEQQYNNWVLKHEVTYKVSDASRDFNTIVNKRHYSRWRKAKEV